MIYRLKLGNPIETEAVVNLSEVADRNTVEFTELLGTVGIELSTSSRNPESDEPSVELVCKLSESTSIFGLGETARGINKRGFVYVSDNTDETCHTETTSSLYGSHNFLVFKGAEEDFGLFFDTPSKITFDLGFTVSDLARITSCFGDMYIYYITGADLNSIVRQFRVCIGKSYIAPSWAFGFQQSRFGYMNEDDIREVVNRYRSLGIPLDAVYMDIDYMQDYKIFTTNRERFPKFGSFVREMEDQGIHLVPIVDAGIKVEKDYDIYEEGKANGYFCTREDSSLFTMGVWPGWCHLTDFFKPEASEWFGNLYERFTCCGIDGFWNDMNEPAMFYTEESVAESQDLFDRLKTSEGKLSTDDFFRLKSSIDNWRSHEYYKDIYHLYGGKKISHDKVHNLYGYQMTKAAALGLERCMPEKRALLFSRSSYIGMHRYAGIWTGDNRSWWSHLLMNIRQLPSLSMCGFLYSGADIGGFGSDTSEDLMLRWTALGIFTPLFRNHSTCDVRFQECYRFNNIDAFREIISLRYRLIPYLYSEYLKAVHNDEMLFKPLCFEYEDDVRTFDVEDQLLLGESIMIAPVYEQNAKGRYVYLPEDMLFVKFTSASDYTAVPMTKGYHHIDVSLSEIPMFIRKGHILPLGVAEVCTADMRRYYDAGSRGDLSRSDFEIIASEEDMRVNYEMYTDSDKTLYISTI